MASEEPPPAHSEPLWRQVLNWGLIIYFLGLPALGLILALTRIPLDFAHGENSTHVAQFLANFHFSVSALVAAMAGLNSFDRYKVKANGDAKKAVEKEPGLK